MKASALRVNAGGVPVLCEVLGFHGITGRAYVHPSSRTRASGEWEIELGWGQRGGLLDRLLRAFWALEVVTVRLQGEDGVWRRGDGVICDAEPGRAIVRGMSALVREVRG